MRSTAPRSLRVKHGESRPGTRRQRPSRGRSRAARARRAYVRANFTEYAPLFLLLSARRVGEGNLKRPSKLVIQDNEKSLDEQLQTARSRLQQNGI